MLLLAGLAFASLHSSAIEVKTVRSTIASGAAPASAVLNASGYVIARRQATVASQVVGRVAEVFVEEGMDVERGQVLARLDDSAALSQLEHARRQLEAAQKTLAEIQVRLAQAQRTLRRNEHLRAQKLVSESQLDAARTEALALAARLEVAQGEVAVARSQVRVREQDLDELKLIAPFSGVVVSKDAQPGEVVSPMAAGGLTRTAVVTLVDMSSREIEVDVNESFINRLRPEQRAEAILDAYPDWAIPSHVINIVPTADRQKATVRVRIGFDALDSRILPNMGVKVRFLEDEKPAPVAQATTRVPASAIVTQGTHRYVWRVRDDALERVSVRVGSERDGQVDVLAGIDAGELIVAQPTPELQAGAKVKAAAN